MFKGKLCVIAGAVNMDSLSKAIQFAKMGCNIAFIDTDKDLGKAFKADVTKRYGVQVFFFHGNVNSEEDRDIFNAAVGDMYGQADFVINGKEDVRMIDDRLVCRAIAYPVSGAWKFVF